MRCAFLKEAEVRFCELAPFRKWIQRIPLPSEQEICSGAGWSRCTLVADRFERRETLPACPFLRRRKMLYCSADPAPRFIPYSDALVSRCQCEAHRYCDAYLSVARPRGGPAAVRDDGKRGPAGSGPGGDVPEAPEHLRFASNHMWLDASSDGTSIVGLDAFLSRIMGRVDSVTFMTSRGMRRPAVDITVNGVDMQIVFPKLMEVAEINLAVREDPSRIVSDPYVRGWLFSGRAISSPADGGPSGLRSGSEAARWMRDEWDRAVRFFHEWLGATAASAEAVQYDGGAPVTAMASCLDRTALLRLFNEFFALRGSEESS